jgi:hypothetical protein
MTRYPFETIPEGQPNLIVPEHKQVTLANPPFPQSPKTMIHQGFPNPTSTMSFPNSKVVYQPAPAVVTTENCPN